MHDLDHCIRDQFILNSHAVQMIESIYLITRDFMNSECISDLLIQGTWRHNR